MAGARGRSHLARGAAILCFLSACPPTSLANPWQDAIGYSLLSERLSPTSLPTGDGIAVTQVEAPDGSGNYLAESGNNTFPAATASFTGKMFTAHSGSSAASGHANTVARFFFGNNTDPAQGVASIAPGITNISGYNASDYLTFFLGFGASPPATENGRIQNHAWITTSPGFFVNNQIQRFDFAIARDDFLAITGMNNGGTIPYHMVTGYNAIAIGRSDGGHSIGVTPSGVDGPGRIKPELVAPQNTTSWATGIVSSAAALLFQVANDEPALADANHADTIKAILLAGATKEEFPNWTRLQSRPLDTTYGAGELNINHSHTILTGGKQSPLPANANPTGWDRRTANPANPIVYHFTIPAGTIAEEFSAFLVWHRQLSFNSGTLTPSLANLDLVLKSATGTVIDSSHGSLHNLEHIHSRNLPPGAYRLEITADTAVPFALAWRSTCGPGPDLASKPNGNALDFTCSNLDPNATYQIMTSIDLITWTPAHTFSPANTTHTWTDPNSTGHCKFYSLHWTVPAAAP
ncbi:MAG: hypothetical protein AAF591_17695 [Verrucomicrobiota bacterium]